MIVKDLKGKVVVITGGGGVLGGSIAEAFANNGSQIVLIGRSLDKLLRKKEEISAKGDCKVLCISCDVLNLSELQAANEQISKEFGTVDILINAAGGNNKGATIAPDQNFFDLDMNEFEKVTKLNLEGTILPCIVFGKELANKRKGCILNVSSMASDRVITRVIGYSASKAAVENFTKNLAVEMAIKFGEHIRVNAIAPGFFIAEQNRHVLLNPDGTYTQRAHRIIENTPMNRFGKKEEIQGACLFLCSDTSGFITGAVLPIDGGFSSFSGV